MDEYSAVLAKLLRLVFARWLERIEQKLQLFAEALDEWLHELFANPTIDWRDRFEQFLAEQEAAGYIVPPESRQELIAYLEHWAASIGLPTPEAQRIADVSRAFGIVPPIARPSFRNVAGRFRKRVLARMFFNDKLREARQRNDEIEQVLAALGRKLDAAEVGETVEAEPAAEAIEILIWSHNDAMEQARGTWLKHNLGNDDYLRIAAVSNPSAHGLPPFVDDEQAERFRQQVLAIGARLDQRIGGMDRAISVMHRLEQAGVGASLLIGGGVLLQAVRTGGKWAIVKTVAQVAASGAVAHATGKAVEHSLRAAGASEETIHGVRLAAEVVTWLLLLRRVHAARAHDRGVPDSPKTEFSPRTAGDAVNYDALRVPGPNPNSLRQRVVTSPTAGEGGVYLKPQGDRVKIGSTADFRARYGPNAPDGIEVEIPRTRTAPAADDSAYRWTARRQARFDEEYLDRITPPDVRYRPPNNPRSPVDPVKWERYRQIFGYGDVPADFGL